jgi:hypothetical protein
MFRTATAIANSMSAISPERLIEAERFLMGLVDRASTLISIAKEHEVPITAITGSWTPDRNQVITTRFSDDRRSYEAFIHLGVGHESDAEMRRIHKSVYPAFETVIMIRCGRDCTMDEFLKDMGHAPFPHYGHFNVIRGNEVLDVKVSSFEEKAGHLRILVTRYLMQRIKLRLKLKRDFAPVLTDPHSLNVAGRWLERLLNEAIERDSPEVTIHPPFDEDVLNGFVCERGTKNYTSVVPPLDCRDQASLASIFTERKPWNDEVHDIILGIPTPNGVTCDHVIVSDTYIYEGVQCYTLLAKPRTK